MDFPGGSVTNIRVLDGFSNIYWRIYTEDPNITNLPGEAPANGFTILKHLSRLKDLELRLRNSDCLVSSYPRRLGLWVFSATPEFESVRSLRSDESKGEQSRLVVGSSTLKVSASGSVTPRELVKNLSTDPQTVGGSTGSQRPQGTPTPTRRVDSYSSSVAIYAAFISAITGSLNLQLIRRSSAIPLGSRTLFTVIERDYYETSRIVNDDPSSISALTTLQVQLTSAGKLTVSLQTTSQPGIAPLCRLGESPSDIRDVAPGADIWLSPSGSVARLVSINPGPPNASSPLPHTGSIGIDSLGAAGRKQWKANVLEWLRNFGLLIDPVDETAWVEVEVWEPFYSRLAGETLRLNEDNSSTLPLKRVLWPAVYCFRRTKSAFPGSSQWMESACPVVSDPLDFAENWRVMEKPKQDETSPKPPSSHSEQQSRNPEPSAATTDILEGIESLSRASEYPDLQTVSLVYPTPPDGAAAMGLNLTGPSDTFAEEPDLVPSLLQNQSKPKYYEQLTTKDRSEADPSAGFGPLGGLAVGSGLYDTNEDDDLFGDMDEKDFGTKGITDADFNFFDDPSFAAMDTDVPADDAQDVPDMVNLEVTEAHPTISDDALLEDFAAQKTPAEILEVAQASPDEVTPEVQPEHMDAEETTVAASPHTEQNQTISPPLSPVEIKRILLPEPEGDNHIPTKGSRKQSYYNPVAFKPNMSAWDQKYGADGKFRFTTAGPSGSKVYTNSDIPTVGIPRRNKKYPTAGAGLMSLDGHASPSSEGQHLQAVSDSSSDTSDDSDGSALESDAPPLLSRKRKRARSNSVGSPAISQVKSLGEAEQEIPVHRPEHSIFLGNLLSTFSDWSMTGYFSLTENRLFPVLTRKDMQIHIAQLFVDQITQSSLDHKLDGGFCLSDLDTKAYSVQTFFEEEGILGGIERLDLNSWISLQDNEQASPAPNGAVSRQSSQRKEMGKGSITKLSPPHLRVRRGKEYLEALPPAISFWETFGLEPADGPKDISAYCIHPQIAGDAADVFLERLGLLYASCNLGKHVRGSRSSAFERGLYSWDVGSLETAHFLSAMQSLKVICEELGTALLKGSPSNDSLVIYIINPFAHASALVDICSAFWCLFQKYIADTGKQQARQLNEVVLQIIPISFIMSTGSVVVPLQAQYLNLALEIYSRCPPKALQSSLVNCAPPVLLAEPLPRTISFRLASEKTSPLQEGKCLHIAYSKSQDQRWIGVAWSDNSGALQRTISYNLRYRNASAVRSISDVRSEIWVATKDILDRIQARWKVFVVSTEPVDQDEVDAWTSFIEQYNKANSIPLELTILSVNTAPDLHLEPPFLPMSMSIFNPQTSSTPVATPNASGNVFSPDQSGTAPTPPSGGNAPANAPTPTEPTLEAETESVLTDICDDSWGVILSHRLNNSPHLTEYRPALASGYLLRRKGDTDGDGVYAMTLNLIYTQRPSSCEAILRETLGMYRDLGTLARARGTRTVQRNTLPWHIATAVRAQEMLSHVL
ncbi:mediator complex subunit 13 C-terminal-domain-containing protein [Aspergillus transmontanensis]|uniref:Mediator of RNA polymerase II transcription subunit 13 n=1 Tax=Aspergillus transmontanensis TaxID=1034304 RepID=A0A5N6WGB3_9EURO|nr:mediator complex subunit 13 C-terminal-domain-containing protein [Aspergillus transmontanensis]